MQSDAFNFAQKDEQAVRAVRTGDAERYRELVERHERRVYAVAWSRLGDAALAEEATQEAFIRAYRRLWLLGDGTKFSGWVNTIARRVAINLGLRHRRELNKRERWALENPGTSTAEDSTDESDPLHTPEALRQTLAELPAAYRECLVLFYLEGKSGTEAAAALGISEAALRVRLHRARAALRERLEERLADSLGKLAPGKTLVPAIMAAILTSSPAKAATAGGVIGLGIGTKLLAPVAKFIPLAALVPLVQVVGSLPGLLFASWLGRVERRNYRDAEGFRARLHQGYYRSFLWGFPLMILLIVVPIQSARAVWGMKGMYVWTVSLVAAMTLLSARSLTINRNPFQIGMFAYCCIITTGMAALAWGWLPPMLSSLPMIVATVLFIFVLGNRRPVRMDYSLFLRAAQGLLRVSAATDDASSTQRFDRAALLSFARFLGSRWLVANYRWETLGLALRLPWVNTRFLRNMGSVFVPISRGCSSLLLRWDGTVGMHCGEADAADLAAIRPDKTLDPAGLELEVAVAVEQAWREFGKGDIAAAEQAVGELPEVEVFVLSPRRAASTRWLQVWLGVTVIVMIVAMVLGWRQDKLRMVNGRHLQPVSFTEADIRAALARLGEGGAIGSNALYRVSSSRWLFEVWPPQPLFTSSAWQMTQAQFFKGLIRRDGNALQRVDRLLGTPDLLRAIANGWLSVEDLGLTREEVRRAILEAPEGSRQRWFTPDDEGPVGNLDGTLAGYTALNAEDLARRVLCLKRFGCLDAVDGSAAVETLLKHQVLSETAPPGHRSVAQPKLLHGTFFTFGQDPIRDTYHALVVLESFGALDRVDCNACIRGILRFHHGGGLFGSVQQGDGFVIFGDSRDTFWAFESLRMLGALDHIKDLDRWQFRPEFVSKKPTTPDGVREITWSEIEAWVCQQRLEHFLRERKQNPQSPARSLLEP
jgi:RNA polymerase sigma factor (sigma-70 family)